MSGWIPFAVDMTLPNVDTAHYVNYYGHKNYQRIKMDEIQKILPVTRVKRELLDILRVMEDEYSTITITRNGEPVGIMMTPDRYEGLLETIEILSDSNILRALKSSQKDFSSGKSYTHAEVWSK